MTDGGEQDWPPALPRAVSLSILKTSRQATGLVDTELFRILFTRLSELFFYGKKTIYTASF